MRERLAPFKVPKQIYVTDDLPLTASGKIQKFVLRQRILRERVLGERIEKKDSEVK